MGQRDGGNRAWEVEIGLINQRADQRLLTPLFVCALAKPWPLARASDTGFLKSALLTLCNIRFDSGSSQSATLATGRTRRTGFAFNSDAGKFGTTSVRQAQVSITGALTTYPFLPGELTQMAARADGDKANGLPPTAARQGFRSAMYGG